MNAIRMSALFRPNEFMMANIYAFFLKYEFVATDRAKTQNSLWSLWRVPKQRARELKWIDVDHLLYAELLKKTKKLKGNYFH